MKKGKIVGLAMGFLLAGALYALADVDVTGTVEKTKDVTETETITITKDIDVNVSMKASKASGEKAAEAYAVLNQDQTEGYACENCAEKTGQLVGSVLNNAGLVNVNQASGNMANQSNMISAAIDKQDENNKKPASGFAQAQSSAEQMINGNEIDTINVIYRNAIIISSIKDNTGVVMANQSVGNISNQANLLTLGVSLNGLIAMSEADLGQACTSNLFSEFNTHKLASVADSINTNTGVIQVNQSAGVLGNQLNAVNVSASVYGL